MAVVLLSIPGLRAQNVVLDTVSMGALYSNEIYYSLPNDEQGSAPMYNWDMCFTTSLMDASIRFNHAKGITVIKVPNADSSGFASLDTTGIASWTRLYNSDTSWNKGALNQTANSTNPFDFGWGIYDMSTHDVTGDSLYVVRIAPPSLPVSWVKIFVKKKTSTNDYLIRVGTLDNSFDQVYTIPAGTYTTKNFIYVAYQNGIIDREPASANWDIVFSRYATYIPGPGYYNVTGVLQNHGVTVAQAYPVDAAIVSVTPYLNSFQTNISEIGYDWKYYDMGTNSYLITDSTAYFVKLANGNIWKMIFTGFDAATGTIIFSKELVQTNSIDEIENEMSSVMVYPNPTANLVTLMFDSKTSGAVQCSVYDLCGREVMNQSMEVGAGFQTHAFNVSSLTNGTYLLNLTMGSETSVVKLIVNK